MRKAVLLALMSFGVLASAQTQPLIFVESDPSFNAALSAAIQKKHTPVQITTDEDKADFILQTAGYDSQPDKWHWYGHEMGQSNASVQLVSAKTKAVVWAYQVRKAGYSKWMLQSVTEAVAKHLREDMEKRPEMLAR